jgi:hypothetical protein
VLSIRCISESGIQEGEEICISYVDPLLPTVERQRILRDTYFFTCDCKRCQKYASKVDPFAAYRCPNNACGKHMEAPRQLYISHTNIPEVPEFSTPVNIECPHCHSIHLNFEKTMERHTQLAETLLKTKSIVNQGIQATNTLDAIDMIVKATERMKRILMPTHYDYIFAQRGLFDLLFTAQEWPEALKRCQDHAKVLKDLVSPYTSNLGTMYLTIAAIAMQIGQCELVAYRYFREAHKLLFVTHGPQHRQTLQCAQHIQLFEAAMQHHIAIR